MSENINHNNHLEQLRTKNFKALAIFALSAFLVVGIVVWVLLKKENTNEIKVQKESSMQESIKDKEFNENASPNDSVIGKNFEPQNEPQTLANSNQNIQIAEKSPIVKPRIIKGLSVSVVASNANEANPNQNSQSSDLSLYDKPNTVLEFGQNGGGKLESLANNNSLGGNSMQGEVFTPSVASYSKFNPSLTLTKGTYIGCALKTRLVSEVKGGIACIVSNDVYSSNGHTLLIEKGSIITGSYSGGELNDGSTRLFVIWQEIRTPNNILIPVNSNASDELGASGMEGYVNHHYMKRFGAAILLSIIDDSFSVIADKLSNNSKGNNYYDYTENSREQASKIAEIALEKMIDIKPTLYKNQGDLVGVYVNRDIDFSKVYGLRQKR
ncbi:type IV secretion system protein VirB10 [Campylobacter upsaliensis]|uniref:type IV secretion system protein VirB10 n=1 Tax=Campylobacter TaxID=194 RepID=UPI000E1277C9|nr:MULTISPECIES: type IV secretion system protein VirB10 [Campylobacter]EEY3085998.1 TrbI/VirB10 family protein [Campylobacter jejuni]EAH5199929.1 TrbI/VirB10 family protein [Campylobacter upsaliensis]EAI3917893.1 TrbI/VirB10 family protein [Campylobacter upsaliensis]EAI4345264.1 TrbI/VirB10 family protein [Campylobacter upsaliensis]EAI8173315.1 TrbI/VirB10 family protein [Campylobacter upsaliensis]